MEIKTIHRVVNSLFEPETRRMERWLDKIAKSNSELNGLSEAQPFLYGGALYATRNHKINSFNNAAKNTLHPSLNPQMKEYLSDLTKSDKDKQLIRQSIYLILDQCVDTQDLRDALPEIVVQTLAVKFSLQKLERAKPELFTILHNSRAMKSYERVQKSIEFYCASALLN